MSTNGHQEATRETIGDYLDRNEITPAELAERLGRAGRPTSVNTTKRRDRAFPKAWAKVLAAAEGYGGHDPEHSLFTPPPDPTEDERDEGRRTERPPERPAGAKLQAPAATSEILRGHARKRIAGIYDFAGTSLGMAIDPQGANSVPPQGPGGGIVTAWAEHSGPIAEAWIAAAEEGNVWAQKFVALMATGGTAGELVILHLSLVGATLYVSGQIPEIGPLYGKYRKYRPAAPAPAKRDRPDGHGTRPAGAGDSVAGAPVAA